MMILLTLIPWILIASDYGCHPYFAESSLGFTIGACTPLKIFLVAAF